MDRRDFLAVATASLTLPGLSVGREKDWPRRVVDYRNKTVDGAPMPAPSPRGEVVNLNTGERIPFVFFADDRTGEYGRFHLRDGKFYVKDLWAKNNGPVKVYGQADIRIFLEGDPGFIFRAATDREKRRAEKLQPWETY